MEQLFSTLANDAALFVQAAAVVIIVGGAIEALYGVAVCWFGPALLRQEIWRRFALWLILALEFTLAADIIRTAIAPTWSDIGQLGAIALIRTFLNYFLERDLERNGLR